MNEIKMDWQGKMELIEQEGGYASPQLYINGINITRTLWDRLGGGEDLFKIEGEWELTLRRIK